ncbi:c-type heme family protein [Thermodesulfobacterium hveragerdense]|uniref:c-type heme family protein n=1 Tax=Thermodesulfobacterium hveragerdense TaxID=53424 RepID=UPI00042743A7|nr:DUF3365 domain-containing protein [Thermodesulfobacterium hveragerdense]
MKKIKFIFKDLSLSTKFTLYLLFVITFFCFLFSTIIYYFLKNQALEEARREAEILITQIDALGDYVKEELRPSLFRFFKESNIKEDFILEAMSTTHIKTKVMQRFKTKFVDYDYRRISIRPINPQHLPNDFEKKFLNNFMQNPNFKRWENIVDFNKDKYLVVIKPIRVEKECLVCHGKAKDAPKSLLKIYPRKEDFHWKVGDLMGLEAIYVPLENWLLEIKHIAITTFISGMLIVILLLVTIEGVFWAIVGKSIKKLTVHFRNIISGKAPLSQRLEVERRDEIGELLQSFNQLAKHLFEAQEAIKTYAQTLQTIFNHITDPLALVNLNCKVEVSNKAYQEWVIQKKGPVFSMECDPLKADKNKTCPIAFIRRVIETKQPVSEYISSPEGGYYYTHLYPVFDQTGKVIKVVHYVEDVTEKKRIEEQMAITAKLATIGQLAAGIAHEINNPLGGIILCLNNVIRSSMDEQTKNQHIELINQGLSRIQNIIKVLLDFSRTTELNLRVCEVKDLIENVLRLINYCLKEKNVKVKIDLEKNLRPVCLDSNKIEQVMLNLILNAIDAMENSEEKVLTIKVYHKESKMFIEVSDTGSGIPPHLAEKVFDPFFTTKPLGKGTGLGLFISKSIVEQHGGKIWFTTSEKGTTFVVEIPLEGRRIYEG